MSIFPERVPGRLGKLYGRPEREGAKMVMEGFTALPECSRKAQTTPDRARYWLKLLGVETAKSGNVRYVPNSAVDLLGNMARMISAGMTPGEAAKRAKEETPADFVPAKVTADLAPDSRLEGIEKALLLLAEENRALRAEVSAMRQALEYKPQAPMPTEEKKRQVITPAPIRAAMLPPAQREISYMESIQSMFADVWGFAFGRG